MAAWRLEDVEARQRIDPRRNPIPRRQDRASLEPGELVKLVFLLEAPQDVDGERMWVEVEAAADGAFVGRLCNQPRYVEGLAEGDRVPFEPRHVAALFEPPVDAEALAIVSRRVADEEAWPSRLVREPPRDEYSGWQVLAGDEPGDFFRTAENARVRKVGDLLDLFPVLASVFAVDEPAEWRWDEGELEYRRA